MKVKYLQRLRESLKGFGSLALVLFCCFGCAASGNVGKSAASQPDAEAQGRATEESVAPGGPAEAKDRLVSVLVHERGEQFVIQMTATRPFKDYQFRRLGSDRFTLEMPTIASEGELPTLPQSMEKLSLCYDVLPPSGLQLTGSFTTALDQYVINAVQDSLVLTLDLARDPLPHRRVVEYQPPSPIKSPTIAKKKDASVKKDKSFPDASQMTRTAQPSQPAQGEDPSFSGIMQRTKYEGKPISLDLMDADLRNVLRLLADLSGTNMVIEPDVSGKVTLKVDQVPWDQVLDMVLAMNDLGKERIGNVIRIAKQFKLKDEWSQKTAEIKARQELLEAAKDLGEMTTAYLSVNYAQPVDVAAKITEGKSEKGRISVDDRTSLIIYVDYPARIEAARQLLARLDKATPQVLIEARIVTATSDITRSLGINWSINTSHTTTDIPPFQNFQVNSFPNDLFGFNIAQVFGETLVRMDFRLSALETANELKIMAAPRVLTMNNVKATITQGTQIPYLRLSEFNVSSIEFKDATLELAVTPHITPDKKVRLEIKAKQDEPTAQTFSVGTGSAQAVGIDTRKIDTELLVDDGSIVVIGGVIRNRDTKGRTGTPGLKNIPLIGRLFKSDTEAATRQSS